MITNYTKYINENNSSKLSNKDFAINELCYNIEHDCFIDLINYNEYCVFNVIYNEKDEEDLKNNFLESKDYAYVDEFIDKYIKEDIKIPILNHNNQIDKITYYYLCTIIYNNFILDNTTNANYYDEIIKVNRLRLNKYDYIIYVLTDIKNNIYIKNLNNIEKFCKEYFKNKYLEINIYFKELLNYLNNKELLDEYIVMINANKFDLI